MTKTTLEIDTTLQLLYFLNTCWHVERTIEEEDIIIYSLSSKYYDIELSENFFNNTGIEFNGFVPSRTTDETFNINNNYHIYKDDFNFTEAFNNGKLSYRVEGIEENKDLQCIFYATKVFDVSSNNYYNINTPSDYFESINFKNYITPTDNTDKTYFYFNLNKKQDYIVHNTEELIQFLSDSYEAPENPIAKTEETITWYLRNKKYNLILGEEFYDDERDVMEFNPISGMTMDYFYDYEEYNPVFKTIEPSHYYSILDGRELEKIYSYYEDDTELSGRVYLPLDVAFNNEIFKFKIRSTRVKGTIPIPVKLIVGGDNLEKIKELYPNHEDKTFQILVPLPVDATPTILITSNPIATATSTVSQGISETKQLTYLKGKNRNDLQPGQTYLIDAEYKENNQYQKSSSTGTLMMLKQNTQTSITGPEHYKAGDALNYTITVSETKNNTPLTNGTLTIYTPPTWYARSTYTINSTTTTVNITIPNGTSEIYAIYNPEDIGYNSSESNHITLTPLKDTTITIEDTTIYTDNITSIPIKVTDEQNNPVSTGKVRVTLEKIVGE